MSFLGITVAELLIVIPAVAVSYVALRPTVGNSFAITIALIGLALYINSGDPTHGVAVAVVGVAARLALPKAPASRQLKPFLIQCAFIGGGFGIYQVARIMTRTALGPAYANSLDIIAFEQALGLYIEPTVQGLILGNEPLMRLFNLLYHSLYFPVTAGMLLWLYLSDRPHFRIYRNCLAISAILGAVTILLFPVAPPRLVPDSGMVSTFQLMGQEQVYANPHAAVPSLHCGWSFLTGYILGRSLWGNRAGIVLALVCGGFMTFIVMATGNHYWFDAAVGAAYSVGPALFLLGRKREPIPVPAPRRPAYGARR